MQVTTRHPEFAEIILVFECSELELELEFEVVK